MYVKLNFDKYKKYVSYKEEYDENSKCRYIITRITKYTDDNKRIFPRVRTTGKDYESSTSLKDFMKKDEILFAINAGIFNTKTKRPECVLIRNKKVLVDQSETYKHTNPIDGGDKREELYILGINERGNLKIYEPNCTGQDMLDDDCVDAVMGFVPLIINHQEATQVDEICPYGSYDKHPRQVIGQYDNHDYFVLTVLQPGMTFEELRKLLHKLNVKIAYNLDGGSSTQTVFHKTSLTPAYKEETGRKIPTVITFEIIDAN
jgi:exopolysaccharide biosynthesis protein